MAKRKTKTPVMFDKAKFLLPKMEFFELDETGEGFYLCELGGKELLEYNELIKRLQAESGDSLSDIQGIEIMINLVVKTACDAKGHPVFSEEDVASLSRKSPALLLEIADRAMAISGIKPDQEVADDLKNVLNSSSTDS
jgi:hypothetical protein